MPLIFAAVCALFTAVCIISVVKLSAPKPSNLGVAATPQPPSATPQNTVPVKSKKFHKTAAKQTEEGNAASTPSQPSQQAILFSVEGDKCVSYDPLSLLVGSVDSGYRVKNEDMEVPITFASFAQAHNFLSESRKHAGMCWPPSIEEDVKNGNDGVVIWRDSLLATPGQTTFQPLTLFGPSCEPYSNLAIQQDDEGGPVNVIDLQTFATTPTVLFTFNSKDKARRVVKNLRSYGTLCFISLTKDDFNKTHPMVAYQPY
jgi:hypothetical protein